MLSQLKAWQQPVEVDTKAKEGKKEETKGDKPKKEGKPEKEETSEKEEKKEEQKKEAKKAKAIEEATEEVADEAHPVLDTESTVAPLEEPEEDEGILSTIGDALDSLNPFAAPTSDEAAEDVAEA